MQLGVLALITLKADISPQDFSSFWSDAHGPMLCRFAGMSSYVQYHLGTGIDLLTGRAPADRLMPSGLAQVCYPNLATRARRMRRVTAEMLVDDRHCFSRIVTFMLDQFEPPAISPGEGSSLLIARLSEPDGVASEDLAQRLEAELRMLGFDTTISSWLVPEPMSFPVSDNDPVVRTLDPGDRIAALALIAHPATASDSPAVGRLAALGTRMAKIGLTSLDHLPVEARHVLVRDGETTVAGERGAAVASLIERLGAENHLSPAIRSLFAPKFPQS